MEVEKKRSHAGDDDHAATTDRPKKKKARWRNQKAKTLVVTQLAYGAGAAEVAAHLAVEGRAPTVRLVADGASAEGGEAGR